jgi:hydrocephalus-inducing protein
VYNAVKVELELARFNCGSSHHRYGARILVNWGCNHLQEVSVAIDHENEDSLEVDNTPTLLKCGGSRTFSFVFTPMKLGLYHARIPIEVNGLYKVHVDIRADVVRRCFEVVDPAKRTLELGSIRTGKMRKLVVEVVNRAPIPANVDFIPSRHLAETFGIHLDAVPARLGPRQHGSVSIMFKPKCRMANFLAKVIVNIDGVASSLMSITGSALGLEARLGATTLPFGSVVLGSRTTKFLPLHNSGPYPCRLCTLSFNWPAIACQLTWS